MSAGRHNREVGGRSQHDLPPPPREFSRGRDAQRERSGWGVDRDAGGGGNRGVDRFARGGGSWGSDRGTRGGANWGSDRGTRGRGSWGSDRGTRGRGNSSSDRGMRGGSGRGDRFKVGHSRNDENQDRKSAPEVRPVDFQDIIFHSFLPKQIPDIIQPNLIDIEAMMLQYTWESVSETSESAQVDFSDVIVQTKKMLETWKLVQPRFQSESDEDRFVQSFKQEIRLMKNHDTLPIYIRKQNCTIMVTKLDEQKIQIATFRAMLPSSMVMSSVGSIEVKLPETCDVIYNNDLLSSDPFLKHLHELSVEDIEISLPTTKKGETNYTDYRDVADPFLVSDWIVGALVPATPNCTSDEEPFQKLLISKKFRDEVTQQMSSRAIPFRRSGMWTSIKVVLQLKLLMNMKNENDTRITYKIIMLRILTYICQQYTNQCHSIDWDLTSQMLAKISRRVCKLENMTSSKTDVTPLLFPKIEDLKTKSLEHVLSIITPIQQRLTGLWRKVASSHPVIKPITRTSAEFEKDLEHEIHWLNDHIKKRNSEAKSKKKTEHVQLENYQKSAALEKSQIIDRCLRVQRFLTSQYILKHKHAFNYAYSEIDEINERVWLFDTENFIKNFQYNEDDVKLLPEVILAYIKIAIPVYMKDKDPVCCSQMLLVILKAIQIFDVTACEKFPLLLEYMSGIQSKHFEKLLLPHQDDINLSEEIISHFESRNESALCPCLLETNEVDENSFAVRFAINSELMNKVRETILNDTKIAIEEKFQQLNQTREDCRKLQRDFDRLGPCNRTLDEYQHDNKAGTRARKALTCKRCIITRDLKWKRNSITIYERPLPPEEHLQFAVVFELKLPKEIAILRDLLSLFNFEMLGQSIFNGNQKRPFDENPKSIDVMGWCDYIKKRGKEDEYKSGPGNGLHTLSLVSPKIPASGTSYTKLHNPDVLENSNDRFIVENDLDCVYYHEKPLWYPFNKNVEEFCVFKLDTTANSEIYSNLQWTIGSTHHTQNSVLARKTQCHQQLNIDEFAAFGTLRAGNRIQLLNLYRFIYDRVLSLQREPVLALTLQTIWQVGPIDKDGIRDSHVDFKCTGFCMQFLKLLEELVASREINYSEPLILFTVILITIRMMELNDDEECRDYCYQFLKKCRDTVNEWVRKIEDKIANSDEELADNMITFLKTQLLEATICSVFTYNVSNDTLAQIVIRNKEDMANWFHSLARLHQLTEEEQLHKTLSTFSKTLLNNARIVALKLNLESRLETDQLVSEGLHLFACEKWGKAKDCTEGAWKSHDKQNHLVLATYEEDTNSEVKKKHFLHFDFILGTFLVNGFLQSNLPAGLMEHPLYQRFFKDASFRTQRYSTCARTIDAFHGKFYDFEVVIKAAKSSSKSGAKYEHSLIVREVQEDGNELELLNHDLFRGDLGNPFIENYTHWLDLKKNVVYFRRLPVLDSDYKLPPEYILLKTEGGDGTMNKNGSWKFHDERLKKEILCIHSEGFKMISSTLSRLESKDDVIAHRDDASNLVTARLSRYHLHFNLEDEILHSVEFEDFRVASNQNLGTLIGLQQGLLLELGSNPDKFTKRILIVPHGQLVTRQIQHQTTVVELYKLRQPSFFVYEYDTVLKKLKADKSKAAWLYLAALHASTACSLPDPFTAITGTEAAVDILQSGYVFSSSPFDKESLTTLEVIRGLSPKRSYYAHGINLFAKSTKGSEKVETTIWPEAIPAMAAFDGYAFIVDRLVEMSQRLSPLHPQVKLPKGLVKRKEGDEVESEKLQLRSYLRHLSSYNQAVHVKPEYMKKSTADLVGTSGRPVECKLRSSTSEDFYLKELLCISQARLVNTFEKLGRYARNTCNLGVFLITGEPIYLPYACSIVFPRLKDLLHKDLRTNWMQLYLQALLSKTQQQKQAYTIMLSAMAYRGAPLEQVMNLHHISILSNSVEFPIIPESIQAKNGEEECEQNIVPILCDFNEGVAQSILEAHALPMEIIDGEKMEIDSKDYLAELKAYKENVKIVADRITSKLKEQWPCEKLINVGEIFKDSPVNYEDAMKELNSEVAFWYRNYQFNLFVQAVEEKLNKVFEDLSGTIQEGQSLYSQYQFGTFTETNLQTQVVPEQPKVVSLYESLTSLDNEDKLEFAKEIFETGRLSNVEEGLSLAAQREFHVSIINLLMDDILRNLKSSMSQEIMNITGIIPRTTPILLLKYLLNEEQTQRMSSLVTYVGALGVLWSHLKRLNRCIALELKGDSVSAELRKELDNAGHVNWSPKEFPEWLLLELELDVMIRPVQVDVARQMMNMPDGKSGVMQLNMGEGKTTVIVPMLCSVLAREEKSLCRVTVLTSIFKTNLSILSFAIGGLINRRLYTFPSRRDMSIDLICAENLMEAYEECLSFKGVVLTLPEYRLSFRLLAYDKILKGEIELGTKLLEVENWLRFHSRDILDESDELLNVKYQLVYTTGEQMPIDGDEIRWTTCQKILKCVKTIVPNLLDKYGSSTIFYSPKDQQKSPEQFTMLRLLSESEEFRKDFYDTLAEELLKDMKLRGYRREVVKRFITEESMESDTHTLALAYFVDKPELLNKVLLYSAYLRRGVLFLALSKRWRVEYGVDPRGPRASAVPFRAKDVAAERTEFGHPDLAIVLTHLSYYYSGLSDSQLEQVFDIIKNKLGAETIYNEWIQEIPEHNVPKFLRHYEAINLHDVVQRSALFNMLRRHKLLVDFWLSHEVFPRESKQFPGKIVMTAGDLCYERHKHPVSGFSGTNDSSVLLPLPISQQDLPELENTNAKLENTLLKLENGNHEGLEMGVKCFDILQKMKKNKLRILIDAGALMLDCDNEQVAELWLEVETDPSLEAVVYFSKDNELLVKYRRDAGDSKGNVRSRILDVPLDLSPYRDRLESCGVFLDDQHTRGTDLKFPNGMTACVTVGTRMRRDKLVQACMRMRKLGNGHSVQFYVSHEAYDKVMDLKVGTNYVEMSEIDSESNEPTTKKSKSPAITTEDILAWVKQNTEEFNRDGLLYWALSSRNYAQKLAAEDNFNFPLESIPLHSTVTKSATRFKILASQCVDDEVTLLMDMYGKYAVKELLVNLIPQWFESARKKLQSKNADGEGLPVRIMAAFASTCNAVVKRCQELAPEKKIFSSMMEEEQEKELEKEKETEVEEEREMERPNKANEVTPWLHENVRMAVLQGGDVNVKPGIVRLSDVFSSTSFRDRTQPEHWGTSVFATEDFSSVIQRYGPHSKTDFYLRPIEYLISTIDSEGKMKLLILSSFEVNELIPKIRKSESTMRLHMFSRRKFPYQELLINNPHLQLPLSETPHIIPEDSKEMAALLLASGSLYFKNTKEQRAVAQFLALVPMPRTEEQKDAFEKEMITETGFLLPPHREANWELFQIDPNSFPNDPTGLIKRILNCRHSVVSDASHVVRLLNEGEYPIDEDYDSERQKNHGVESLFEKYCTIITEK
ncbi:unnamed protein product [Orchesella dallaii]|uniref:ubiquitinyl hydrolase 1 n=1 Tax=Orchesella dallaii TaxID=48710 RepID=A0ABP1RCU9_9HEXA